MQQNKTLKLLWNTRLLCSTIIGTVLFFVCTYTYSITYSTVWCCCINDFWAQLNWRSQRHHSTDKSTRPALKSNHHCMKLTDVINGKKAEQLTSPQLTSHATFSVERDSLTVSAQTSDDLTPSTCRRQTHPRWPRIPYLLLEGRTAAWAASLQLNSTPLSPLQAGSHGVSSATPLLRPSSSSSCASLVPLCLSLLPPFTPICSHGPPGCFSSSFCHNVHTAFPRHIQKMH